MSVQCEESFVSFTSQKIVLDISINFRGQIYTLFYYNPTKLPKMKRCSLGGMHVKAFCVTFYVANFNIFKIVV